MHLGLWGEHPVGSAGRGILLHAFVGTAVSTLARVPSWRSPEIRSGGGWRVGPAGCASPRLEEEQRTLLEET